MQLNKWDKGCLGTFINSLSNIFNISLIEQFKPHLTKQDNIKLNRNKWNKQIAVTEVLNHWEENNNR